MQKFVIFEGLDRCGKDTQIGLLQKKFYPEIWHTFHYSKIPFDEIPQHKEYSKALYEDMFSMMVDNSNHSRNLIFNRSHLGESVYAPLYRGYGGDYIFDIEKKFTESGTLDKSLYLITLVNDPEILIKRDDGDGFTKDAAGIQVEKEKFERAHRKTSIKNKLLINCGIMTPNEIANIIHDFIEIRLND